VGLGRIVRVLALAVERVFRRGKPKRALAVIDEGDPYAQSAKVDTCYNGHGSLPNKTLCN
jgi:hypothetical protein